MLREMAVPLAVLGIVMALITPAARLPAGPADRHRHPDVGHGADGVAVPGAAGGVHLVSHHAAAADAVPPGAEHLLLAPDPAERQHRHHGRRRSDRRLRQLRGGRQLHHRRGDLPGADRHPVRGHQPRRGAHLGSHRALHPGRPAGQADVHRFGPERRADRRDRGQAAAQATGHRSRILRRHGRRLALHPARRRGQHPDHRHQHRGRLPDRRAAARHGSAARRSRPTRC